MKNIFNVYVEMESQEQCDRMKQLCVDNGLKTFESENTFEFNDLFTKFGYLYGYFSLWDFYNNIEVTETEFIELLKQHKNE